MNNKHEISFSVITPTWNRANYLQRLYQGLLAQSYQNFEWIIADDGSTDETESIIRHFTLGATFPIIYIRYSHRVGKIRVDNEAIRQAQGLLTVWVDSDDYLVSHALE